MSSNPLSGLTPYFTYTLLTATIGPLLFGYHLAELNAPQDVITCQRDSITASTLVRFYTYFQQHNQQHASSSLSALPQCLEMNPTQFGLVSSFFTLGGLLGALSAGPFGAKYGRLRTMLYNTAFFTVGPVLEALAPNIGTMTFGRFVSGLGAGAAVVVVPLYISETAPPKSKGFFGAFTQIMTNVGILVAQVLGYFLSKGSLWRIILGVGGVFGALQAVMLIFGGQESPRWMADHGKPGGARKALLRLRGPDVNIEEEVEGWGKNADEVHMEDEEDALISGQDQSDRNSAIDADTAPVSKTATKETLTIFSILRDPTSRPALVAVMTVMVGQQLCGINSIVMYGVSLLADLLASNSALLNIFVAVLNIVVTTASAPLVDKLGRKPCLLASIAGMGSSSLLLAIGITRHLPVLSGIAVLLFVSFFGLGLGPVPFILSSELVGPEAVGATQSWALAANWIATFVVAQFFPVLSEAMGKGEVYYLFAGIALVFGLFVAWYVPETNGKANSDEVWGRGKVGRED